MRTINFSSHVMNVFAEMDTTYAEVKNLMFDLYNGELSEGMTKREAEDKLREMSRKIFCLEEGASKRDRERAYRDYARQYFDIIEEVVDFTVTTGLKDNEWFMALVNYKNLNDGDENLFVNEGDEIIIRLNSNPTTGFVWQLSVDSDSAIVYVSKETGNHHAETVSGDSPCGMFAA